MIDWTRSRAALQEACAGIFDDVPFTAIAMRKPLRDVNGLAAPDPDRPGFDFMGALHLEPSLNQIGRAERASSSSVGDRQVSKTCLTAYVAAWPWVLRQGDHVVTGADRYAVAAAPDRDGSDRVVIWLNKVKS